jgi:non-canonical purine NTP pyrophosphatase (RdgB/HAM1 family)
MALAGWETNFEVGKLEPQVLTVSEAQCKGAIASTSRGSNGFGFDPVFVPAGYSQTFAELSAETKGEISHRALALAGIRMFLSRTLTQT